MPAGRAGSRGSAYLLVLGAVALFVITSLILFQNTLAGRWFTTRVNDAKIAETFAEAAANMTFRAIGEEMNDQRLLWAPLGGGATGGKPLLESWFMFFRLPAPMRQPYHDLSGEPYKQAVREGKDVELDLGTFERFKDVLRNGITYRYDTIVSGVDASSELGPLKELFATHGGRVVVESTGRIVSAFSVLPTDPNYQIPGVTCWTRKPQGVFAFLDDAVRGEKVAYTLDLYELIPEKPLIPVPDLTGVTYEVAMIPLPVGPLLQPIMNKIVEYVRKGIDSALRGMGLLEEGEKLTWRSAVFIVMGDRLKVPLFKIDYGKVKPVIDDLIRKVVPDWLLELKADVVDATIEKQGIFEIRTRVRFLPKATAAAPEDGPLIEKTLVVRREFRVADVQPIASNYSFFVANSKLPYENPTLENRENWGGDIRIDFNKGMGTLVVHNFAGFGAIWRTIQALMNLTWQDMAQKLELPGNVRVNGNNGMRINLNMLSRYFPKSMNKEDLYDFLRVIELPALLSGHRADPNPECEDEHPDGPSRAHEVTPQFKQVIYNFFDKGKPFDWGYFCTAPLDSPGTIWFPMIPMFSRTLLFGDFHMEPPLTLKVEADISKIYTHIKILLVKIIIPPIPPFFAGITIPIPWTWAKNYLEPYGFCRFPPTENGSKFEAMVLRNGAKCLPFSPEVYENLPPNLYSPTQYVKKAGYFYNTSDEFERDVANRTVEVNGRQAFLCDGVSFVNDNLWLTRPLHVVGRGMVVAAGNIHLKANVTKEEFDERGTPTLFSLVARNGAIVNNYGKIEVNACLFGDRGLKNTIGARLVVHGNLVVNRFSRDDCQGEVDVYYHAPHCRSSILALVRGLSKYDPCRYHVTFSSRPVMFRFEDPVGKTTGTRSGP